MKHTWGVFEVIRRKKFTEGLAGEVVGGDHELWGGSSETILSGRLKAPQKIYTGNRCAGAKPPT